MSNPAQPTSALTTIMPWLTGGLAGAIFTRLTTELIDWLRHPCITCTHSLSNHAGNNSDTPINGISFTLNEQKFTTLYSHGIILKNTSRKTAKNCSILISFNKSMPLLKYSITTQPESKQITATQEDPDRKTVKIDLGEMKYQDAASINLITEDSSDLVVHWRGDDATRFKHTSKPDEQRISTSLAFVILSTAGYIVLGELPSHSNLTRAALLAISASPMARHIANLVKYLHATKNSNTDFYNIMSRLFANQPQSQSKSNYSETALLARPSKELIATKHQHMEALRSIIFDAKSDLKICLNDKDWVLPLFVSMLDARMRNVKTTIIYPKAMENARFNLLSLIGCRTLALDTNIADPPILCALINTEDQEECQGIIYSPSPEDGVFAEYHRGPDDYYVIKACSMFFDEISTKTTEREPYNEFVPKIKQIDDSTIFDLLRGVSQYRDSSFTITNLPIKILHPIADSVQRAKVNQARVLRKLLTKYKFDHFTPCAATLGNGKETIIIPPIIEKHSDIYTVAEGHSRLYSMMEDNIDTVRVILVENVDGGPASEAKEWKSVNLVDYRGYLNSSSRRCIEKIVHEGIWSYKPQV